MRQEESEAGVKASLADIRSAFAPSLTDHAHSAQDFLQLKTLLRLLGERIAADTPKVRFTSNSKLLLTCIVVFRVAPARLEMLRI